uniref:COX assembly mitochondrial protein n=1 Tax=Ascaris lumbricoides TaxID=6252 RepID=A0A0M3ISM1_ASCLU
MHADLSPHLHTVECNFLIELLYRCQHDNAFGMHADLSPHLHTVECNFLIELLYRCQHDNAFGKMFGACNYWDEAVWQCTKQERIWRRNNNPQYTKRVIELQHLPESYYTPVLRKLKEEGQLRAEKIAGCRI